MENDRYCPKCGERALPPQWLFCTQCGRHTLSNPTCECGRELYQFMQYCPQCGRKRNEV